MASHVDCISLKHAPYMHLTRPLLAFASEGLTPETNLYILFTTVLHYLGTFPPTQAVI